MAISALGKVFDPPRPGSWSIDLTHFPRPTTKFASATFVEHFTRGFAEGTKMYGILLDHLEQASINGFVYTAPRPEDSTVSHSSELHAGHIGRGG